MKYSILSLNNLFFSLLFISTPALANNYCSQLRAEATHLKAADKAVENYLQLTDRDQKCLGRGTACKQLRLEVNNIKILGEVVDNYLQLDEADQGCLQGEI